MFDKIVNPIYDKILNTYNQSLSGNKESIICINKILLNISNNYLKLISRNEYLNCLLLIQNLFLTDVPDHSFHRGKTRSSLNPVEYNTFRRILFHEFDNMV
ncbi:MAG: hypothetical protein ACFE9S_08395 [Candidatus Hermodarchaeota archaeon]